MRHAVLMPVVFAVALLVLGCSTTPGESDGGAVAVVISSPAGYWQVGSVPPTGSDRADLEVLENTTYQSIDGFGGAFNEAGWDALSVLDDGERQRALVRLFDPREGARFRFGRIPIGASDYALDRYTLADVPDDYALDHFSVDRDQRLLIPYVRASLIVQPSLRMWASAWTPPPWMKTNRDYDSGAMREDPTTLAAYALYLARFVEAYRAEGLTIEAVHVQNEPAQLTRYPSCLWTPELIRGFVRDHLGPVFEARRVPATIWLGTLNTDDARYASVVLGDAAARRHIRGIGVQWGALSLTSQLAAAYPDLPLMQTETVCGNHPWEPGFNPERPPNDHAYGMLTWGRIASYLRAGVRSYMAWNMVLDAEGKNLDSERPWPQNALLVVDRQERRLRETPAYWAFRHFSSFVDVGAVRLGLSGDSGEAMAFRNPGGQLVVVLQNSDGQTKRLTLRLRGVVVDLQLPAYGWASVTY